MARHTIPITNGKGSIELVTGTYNAQASAGGYDASTLNPKSVTIIDGMDTYAFTISATGVLTLHVTDNGDPSTGVQIIGAKFIRTDSTGTIVGNEITTKMETLYLIMFHLLNQEVLQYIISKYQAMEVIHLRILLNQLL